MRIRMIVEVDTDPIPGRFHYPEDCVRDVEAILREQLAPGYNPVVRLHPSVVHGPSIREFLAEFFGPRPRMRDNGTPENYIRAIKALRDSDTGCHLGLKDAKEAVDGYLAR